MSKKSWSGNVCFTESNKLLTSSRSSIPFNSQNKQPIQPCAYCSCALRGNFSYISLPPCVSAFPLFSIHLQSDCNQHHHDSFAPPRETPLSCTQVSTSHSITPPLQKLLRGNHQEIVLWQRHSMEWKVDLLEIKRPSVRTHVYQTRARAHIHTHAHAHTHMHVHAYTIFCSKSCHSNQNPKKTTFFSTWT